MSSSSRSLSFTEVILRRWLKPSISCRVILCTLSFRDCDALVLSVDARRLRNSKEDFRNTTSPSEGCISDHTPLSNSNSVSDSGLTKVSYMREVYVVVRESQMEKTEPLLS